MAQSSYTDLRLQQEPRAWKIGTMQEMDKATWVVIQAQTTWTHSTPGTRDQQEFQTLEFHIHPTETGVEFGTINVESIYKPVQPAGFSMNPG